MLFISTEWPLVIYLAHEVRMQDARDSIFFVKEKNAKNKKNEYKSMGTFPVSLKT